MSKSKAKSNTVLLPDREEQAANFGFMANLRQALEHVGDAEWLKLHSPLEWVRVLADNRPTKGPTSLPSLGIPRLDERIHAIWADWEDREKTSLQSLLWTAVQLIKPDKDVNIQALLLLTYFQDPRPKQSDLIKQLAVGQSTYYRQLSSAVETLLNVVITLLQPSLRLEAPVTKPLIGRDALRQACLTALQTGTIVSLVGASGLGKTSLGAAVADAWRKRGAVFWYTFRPSLTDNVQHLVFSLALFLHQQGAPNLWLQLLAKPQDAALDTAKALAMIRKGLEDLKATPPLFCFDEVDLLLPDDLEDNDERRNMRAFLEALAESPRGGAPMLCIGQRLLIEPTREHIFGLQRFEASETNALLQQAHIAVDDALCAAIQNYTRGNPLLLQLLITLHHLGEPVLANLSHLASAVSLDWFVARLRRHLSEKEQDLLDAVCVFDAPAPASLWRKQAKTLERLAQINLIDRDATDHITLPLAVRDALYRQLPPDRRNGLHVAAAQACATQGAYTLATHHFVLGQQPEMAVWIWHAHRDAEVRQGQSETAWRIFATLRLSALSDEQDRRALALVLADLAHLRGRHEDGLLTLNEVTWKPNRAATAQALELRAKFLAMRGDIDAALIEYRASLDDFARLSKAKPITLRTEMARKSLVRARDLAGARHEALLAKHDVEILLGEIEDETGNLEQALSHFQAAIALAQTSNDPVRLAKTHEAIGILEARRLNTDAATHYLTEASRYFEMYGDVINAVGMTSSNLAFAYLMAQRYREAIAPAQRAVTFFQELGLPYELSLNAANLAEAYVNLGDAEHAEPHAWQALANEEVVVRPQALYILGHVRRLQQRYAEAKQFCEEALTHAEASHDPWSHAYALRTLADVYRDWGKTDAAQTTLEQARTAFAKLGITL